MPDATEYFNRFKTEIIYLWEAEEEVYVRSVPTEGYYAKYKGCKEYRIESNEHIVARAIHACKEVTKEEYENS